MKDVAKLAGVGLGTVSRVLNGSGYVSADVKERVNAAMQQLNFTPNFRAQSLKRQKTSLIALFVPTVNHPFFASISQQIEARLDERGFKLMLVCSQGSVEKENSVISLIVQNRIDGAIFITHHKHDDILPEYPIVTFDRHLGEHTPCVTSDNFDSCYRAVEYLYAHGCKKVGYAGGKPRVDSEVEERLKGYKAAVKAHGGEEMVLFEDIPHGMEQAAAEKFIGLYPEADGVLVSGDMLALNLYKSAEEAGKACPERFKIISFDGIMENWVNRPRLTCIRQDLEKIADALVEQLLCKIKKSGFKKKVVVPSLFLEGETT